MSINYLKILGVHSSPVAIVFMAVLLSSCGGVTGYQSKSTNGTNGSTATPSNPPTYPPGFTTFSPDATSRVIYVSSSAGNDANNGLSESAPVKTIAKGYSLTRGGQYDFLLFRRGDTWRGERLPNPHSGKDATHPFVVSYYGNVTDARPRMEYAGFFIDTAGASLSNFAMIGLDIFNYAKDPSDPAFTGTNEAGLSFVGNGDSLLFEDNRLTYGEWVIQSYPDPKQWTNVALRYNIVTYAYHVQANCSYTSGTFRPSGVYAAHVTGFLIEGNIFDHNGYNESVPNACATMYNHNFYLHSNNDLLMKDNLITRGSSMGIKASSTPASQEWDTSNNTFDNNFLYDNEIGLSISGNDPGSYRYHNIVVTNNVISQTGLSAHTGRGIGWALDLQDFDGGNISKNFFLHQTVASNSYGLSVTDSPLSFRNVTIQDNTFYAINGNSMTLAPYGTWSGNTVSANLFLSPPAGSCTVNNTSTFTGVAYSNNKYMGSSAFCLSDVFTSLSGWVSSSAESGGAMFTGSMVDTTRTLATYAASLGYANVTAFLQASQQMHRYNWKPELTAPAVNAYIKAGFTVQ